MRLFLPLPRAFPLNWKLLIMTVPLLLGAVSNTAFAQVPDVEITTPADDKEYDDNEAIGQITGTAAHANQSLSIRVTNDLGGGDGSTWNRTVTTDAFGNWVLDDSTIVLAGSGTTTATWELKVSYTSQPSVSDLHDGDVNPPLD